MKLLNPFLINNFYAWLIVVLIDTTWHNFMQIFFNVFAFWLYA